MTEYLFSNRIAPLTGSAIREIFKLLADPSIISLAGGNPSPVSFPSEEMAKITAELLQTSGDKILQYGATEGWMPLRETAIALNMKKGIQSKLDEVLILSGSSQGIELAAKVFLNAGDVILVENPTFLGALQTFRSYEAKPIGVDMDEEGVKLGDLEEKIKLHKPKLLYLIPTFQNPSGQTMSLARRQAVLKLAEKYDFLIIEDDPYGELRYTGEAIPCIKSMDISDRVILLNSFSKTVSPGLRVGIATANSKIIRKMVIAKQGMDTCTTLLSQAAIDLFIRRGLYEPHVQKTVLFYQKQLSAMQQAIKTYFPKEIQCTQPEGGLFIWLTLPKNMNATEIFTEAIQAKVAFVPGEHFFADQSGENTFRLNFSMPSLEKIEKGCQILGELLTEKMK